MGFFFFFLIKKKNRRTGEQKNPLKKFSCSPCTKLMVLQFIWAHLNQTMVALPLSSYRLIPSVGRHATLVATTRSCAVRTWSRLSYVDFKCPRRLEEAPRSVGYSFAHVSEGTWQCHQHLARIAKVSCSEKGISENPSQTLHNRSARISCTITPASCSFRMDRVIDVC